MYLKYKLLFIELYVMDGYIRERILCFMKFELFNNETNKVWQSVASGPVESNLQFELELYKKLMNFFQVGDFYYLLFNITILDLDYASSDIEKVLGYKPDEFNIRLFMEIVHPDDRPWLLAYETKASEFLMAMQIEKLMKYKIRYDIRLRKKDGAYIHLLHQSVVVEHDDEGHITRTLTVHTDITHLNKTGKPVLSIIGMDGEPSYLDIDVKTNFVESKEVLSKREKEVLILLIEGKSSRETGEVLNISKQTVDSHRKNMLNKTGLKTTGELIGKAVKNGWL